MRRFCRYSGMEIKKNHKECKLCEFLVEVMCPQYKLDRHVTTKEFYDWFYEHKINPEPSENVPDMAQNNSLSETKKEAEV